MKKAAGVLRSLVRTSVRTARRGLAVNKLMAAMLTPPLPPQRKTRSKAGPAGEIKPEGKARPPQPAVRGPSPTRQAPSPPLQAPSPASQAQLPALPVPNPCPEGKWLAYTLQGANGRRLRYWLYLPQQPATAADGLPLVVMLHGCHQSATEFAAGTRMNLWAGRQGFAVLYPQQSASSQAQRCWKWYDRATQDGGGDVPTLVAMVAAVLAGHAIDRRRIYVAGMSAGAGMAHILALNYPQLFAAAGLHSGPAFGAGHSTVGALGVMQHGAGLRADLAVTNRLARQPAFPGMPTIVIHGEGDKAVRSINQRQLTRQSLAFNGLPADAVATVTRKAQGSRARHNAHHIEDFYGGRKLLVRVVLIDALEHAWSGGDAALRFNAAAGPDASRMMLAFFARHRRG